MKDKDVLELFETHLKYNEVLKDSLKAKEDIIELLGKENKKKDLRIEGLVTEVRILKNQLNRRK